MVIGMFSMAFYWVLPITPIGALALGIVGLKEYDSTRETGKGMGIIGIVLGIIFTLQVLIKSVLF